MENGIDDIFFTILVAVLLYWFVDWLIRKPRIWKIHDKYVMISGCDTGFGKEAAMLLDKMGCNVIATCLTDEGVRGLREEASDKMTTLTMDVTSEDDIQFAFDVVKDTIPEGQGLWGLINNAGLAGKIGPMEWLKSTDIEYVMKVNVFGMINMTNTFLPLIKQANGRIVNVSSVVGRFTSPYFGPYCISKHAVESFSDCYRRELYQFGVSVHIIEPGGHKTSFLDDERLLGDTDKSWNQLSEETKEEYGEHYTDRIKFLSTKIIKAIASSKTENVVKAYVHALFSRFPRRRYLVGNDAYLFVLLSWLPSCIPDYLLQLPFIRIVPAKGKVKSE